MAKLQDFFIYDAQKLSKELLLLEHKKYYVYALLDPRKIGARIYRDLKYVFTLEPFYIGFGQILRYESHFNEADNLWEKPEEIKKYYNPIKIHKIHQIYRDYDLPRVVIIKEGLTLKEAKELEVFCIKQIGRKDKKEGPLTNLTDGGDGWSGLIFTEEHRKNIGKSSKGRNKNKTYEEIMGEEKAQKLKEIRSIFFKNRSKTEETKEKLRQANLGKKYTEETINKLKNKQLIYNKELDIEKKINKGDPIPEGFIIGKRPHSDETKQRIKEANLGKIHIYNPELDICRHINKDDPIPDGWVRGNKPTNYVYTKEIKMKMSESHKGKTQSIEQRLKSSKRMKANNPAKRPEVKRKISESRKGRITIYNKELNIEKRINKDDPIPEGFVLGGRKRKLK